MDNGHIDLQHLNMKPQRLNAVFEKCGYGHHTNHKLMFIDSKVLNELLLVHNEYS